MSEEKAMASTQNECRILLSYLRNGSYMFMSCHSWPNGSSLDQPCV